MRFDRHETLSDPGAAVRRATLQLAASSAVKLSEGVFNFGAFAVGKLAEKVQKEMRQRQETN